jgi:hypothetical protein
VASTPLCVAVDDQGDAITGTPAANTTLIASLMRHALTKLTTRTATTALRRHHHIRIPISTPGPGRLVIWWTTHQVKSRRHSAILAGGSAAFTQPEQGQLTLRLTRSGRALLDTQAPPRLTAHATFAPANHRPLQAQQSFNAPG